MLVDCRINDNSATEGGGIYCSFSSSPTLLRCQILDNDAQTGGGMYCYSDSSPVLTACNVSDNTAIEWQSGEGAGLYCMRSSPALTNCIVAGNQAGFAGGGGMSCVMASSPTLINCSLSTNSSVAEGGGLRCSGSSSPTLMNCILWGDEPDEVFAPGLLPSVNYSDIKGGYPGIGNISADPLFRNPARSDFHLTGGSPCIDTGSSEGVPATDFEGDPRPWGHGYDMGADEYTEVSISGAAPLMRPAVHKLGAVCPNPFNPSAMIALELSQPARIRLAIYDFAGAQVRTLEEGVRESGSHGVRWDGKNDVGGVVASGAYVIRLEVDGVSQTRVALLLK